MKDTLLLIGFFIRSFIKDKVDSEKKKHAYMLKYIIGIIIVIFISVSTINIYSNFKLLGIESLLVPIILLLDSSICIIMAFINTLSNLSLSEDKEFLLSLPVNNKAIFLSKLGFIQILLIPISLCMVPALFTYGILSNASVLFYVYSIIGAILIPITPIFYSTIITLLLCQISIKSKNKELIQMCSTLISLFMAIILLYFIFKSSTSIDFINSILNDSNINKIKFINFLLPLNWLISKALVVNNSLYSLKLIIYAIIFSVLLICITAIIGGKMYNKVLLNISNNEDNLNNSKEYSYRTNNSLLITLIKRDFLNLLKNPQMFLYTFAMIFMFFLIIISLLPVYSSLGIVDLFKDNYVVVFIFFSYLPSVFTGWNAVASSSFSREGRYLELLVQLPITTKILVNSKIITAILFNSIVTIIFILMLKFTKVPFVISSFTCISMISLSFLTLLIAILNDISSPNIKWFYEKDLFKNNFKLFKSILYPVIYLFVMILFYLIINSICSQSEVVFYILAYVSIIITVSLNIHYYKKIILKADILYNL